MKPDLSKLKYRISDKVLFKGTPTEIIAYSNHDHSDYTIRYYSPAAHKGGLHSVDEFGNSLEFEENSAFYVNEG